MSILGPKRRKIERLHFVLAGAQKSGTTALHYFLSKHPDITMGDQQEIHFFDDDKIFSGPVDYALLHRHYPPLTESMIAGDCTPAYLYWKPAMERISNYNPAIKILALLRNPTDRAFAHWNMQRFKGREPLDFLEAVKAESERAKALTPQEQRRFAYVTRGRYAEQLQRVFDLFPREQVKVIKSEEFGDRNQETLNSVFQFLGVPAISIPRNKDRNVVPYERPITSEEREYLRAIFAEDISNLERMLNWDCADWKL
jgi:hypothetical protein